MENKQLVYVFALLVLIGGQLNAGDQCRTISECSFVVDFKETKERLQQEFEGEQQQISKTIAAQAQKCRELESRRLGAERSQLTILYLNLSYGHLAYNFARHRHLKRQQEAFEALLLKHRTVLVPLLEQAQRALEQEGSNRLPSDSIKPINYVLATADSPGAGSITFDNSVDGGAVRAALESRLQLLRPVS